MTLINILIALLFFLLGVAAAFIIEIVWISKKLKETKDEK